MSNSVYEQFQAEKQLFKPYVSWPDRVHLGLNNVDSVSNTLLKKIRLEIDERILWVSLHKAGFSFKSNDEDSLTSDGCIITDKRICYYKLDKSKEDFSVKWDEIATIIHMMNSFYIQRSLKEKTYDLKISDYAMLGRKVDNTSPIVSFFKRIGEATFYVEKDKPKIKSNRMSKEGGDNTQKAKTSGAVFETKSGNANKEIQQDVKQTRRSFL